MSAVSLARLSDANVVVFGAPVALKSRNPNGTHMQDVGNGIVEAGEMMLCDHIEPVVFMLSRVSVAALVDDAMRRMVVYGR